MYATRSAQATAADAVQVYLFILFLSLDYSNLLRFIDFRRPRYYSNRYVEAAYILLQHFKVKLKGMGEYIEHVCYWSGLF